MGCLLAFTTTVMALAIAARVLTAQHYADQETERAREEARRPSRRAWSPEGAQAEPAAPPPPLKPMEWDGEDIGIGVFVLLVGTALSWVTVACGLAVGAGYLVGRGVLLIATPHPPKVPE